jgi:hypothetical protein
MPSRIMDARFQGADRHGEMVGDLVVAQLTQVSQHQWADQLRPVSLELFERVQQVEPGTRDYARRTRISRVHRGQRHGLLVRSAPEASVRLSGAVGRDNVQPGGELRPTGKAVDVTCDLQKDVLRGLFGVLNARQESQTLPHDLRADLEEQRIEGDSVAGGSAASEFLDVNLARHAHPR